MRVETSVIYATLYSDAQAVLEKFNPCQSRMIDDQFTCREGKGCCQGCQFLGPTGCTTKSLTCKLWLCFGAQRAESACNDELNKIGDLAQSLGVPYVCRGSEEMHTNRMAPPRIINIPCAPG